MDNLPPDLQFEQEAIKRKRAIAELLMQNSMQPLEAPVVKGRFQGAINPLQGFAQMLTARNAQQGISGADKASAGIADKYRTGLAEAVQKYAQTKAGTPGQTLVEDTSQEGTGSFDMSGAAGPPSSTVGGVAGDPRRAIVEAMSSPYAPVQRIAQMDLGQMNRTEDRKDQQAFQAEQAKLAREQRSADIQLQLTQGRITKEEADARMAALRKEMQDAQFAQQRTMAQVVAGLRQPPTPPQPRIIQTDQGPMQVGADNRAAPILGQDNKPIKAPPKGSQPLSATAQKELFEADDVSNSSQNAINILKSIVTPDAETGKSQNDLAYEGGTANVRRIGMSFVPVNSEGENATVDLQNKVTGQALEQLKAVFGGMPTEGERKVLMELQGSVNQKAAQRKEIFERAIKLAERRLSLSQDKAKRLREGTYFGAGTATNQDGNQAPAEWAVVR